MSTSLVAQQEAQAKLGSRPVLTWLTHYKLVTTLKGGEPRC